MSERKVAYICSKTLIEKCDCLPAVQNRASIVQDLIDSYELLHNQNVARISSEDATEDELKYFHSSSYVDFLKGVNELQECELEDTEEEQVEYGFSYDCPLLKGMYDVVKAIAGSSLTAAKLLVKNKCDVAINWCGGWHHAQRDSAEGFCYVNDIVIAIQKLTEKFQKILYIDLDVHHGDGVQNAFELSQRVLTLSFHKHFPGFYPGTGGSDDIGISKGKYFSINVPYLNGISHDNFLNLFLSIYPRVVEQFQPSAIVVQCGADALNGDPIGECNLIIATYEACVLKILEKNVPTLLLGGGGYNIPNTARLWASLTAVVLGKKLDEDIPDECEYFTEYGPSFELAISSGNQKDQNSEEYQNSIIETVLKNLICIR